RQGSAYRAEQVALLARLRHEMVTAPQIGQLLGEVEQSPLMQPSDAVPAVNVREIRRTYDRLVRVPKELVEELARVTTRAKQAWQDARKAKEFATFLPWLEKIVHLKRQEAAAIGFANVPYDALLDEYEPGASTAEITRTFAALREELVPLTGAIAESG